MCGIFGVVARRDGNPVAAQVKLIMERLFLLSESRGKEASGVAMWSPEAITVAKSALPASKMIKRPDYHELYRTAQTDHDICVMGHCRLVTNGGQQVNDNNQPAIHHGIVAVHNGIITNVDELWEQFPSPVPHSALDTDVLLSLVHKFTHEENSLPAGMQTAFAQIEGVASIAMMFEDFDQLALATNNGSLYLAIGAAGTTYIFASERYILEMVKAHGRLRQLLGDFAIEHIQEGTARLIDLDTLEIDTISLASSSRTNGTVSRLATARPVVDTSPPQSFANGRPRIPGEGPYILAPSFVDEFPRNKEHIDKLRRCTRCVLPETMPFIEFDAEGVCNYCHHYPVTEPLGIERMRADLAQYQRSDNRPDCLLPISGGRDSCYTLHVVKTELDMNPVAYTYDWGMVTDLARRNQMRLCGMLGVEHILVSANIDRKRRYIRKNVLAWLKKPDLGMVPLFMAGDKQYFYFANQVARQTDTHIKIYGENHFERTGFKFGFAAVQPLEAGAMSYHISRWDRLKLARYYGLRFLGNPAYINSSILDTIGAYLSYYVLPHNYINLYDYVRWDEETITRTLLGRYNWETATDTESTWRIGDGTAPFYNYIYYTIAGLSENDTFRSNQIREGMITREEGLRLVAQENQPRYESMQWYCDVIGIDFYDAVRAINAAPRLYATRD